MSVQPCAARHPRSSISHQTMGSLSQRRVRESSCAQAHVCAAARSCLAAVPRHPDLAPPWFPSCAPIPRRRVSSPASARARPARGIRRALLSLTEAELGPAAVASVIRPSCHKERRRRKPRSRALSSPQQAPPVRSSLEVIRRTPGVRGGRESRGGRMDLGLQSLCRFGPSLWPIFACSRL